MHKRTLSILLVLALLTSGLPLMFLLGEWDSSANITASELSDPDGLIISGLLSDPLPGEPEFVEIYNPKYDPIQIRDVSIMVDGIIVFKFLESESIGAMMTIRILFGDGESNFNSTRVMYDRYSNIPRDLIPDDEGLVEIVSESGEILDALEYSRDGNTGYNAGEGLWFGEPAVNGPMGSALGRTSFKVPSSAEMYEGGRPIINEVHFGNEGYIELFNPGGQIDLGWVGIIGHQDLKLNGKLEQDSYLIIPLTSSFDKGMGGIGSSMIWNEPIGIEAINKGQMGVELNGELADYVRFEYQTGDGIESSSLYQMAVSEGQWVETNTGDTVHFNLGSIGRDHISTDTDKWDDWKGSGGVHANGPTPGNRNIYSLCFLYIDDEGSFILTNYGSSPADLSTISLLNYDGKKFDLPDISIPPVAELKLVPNSTGTDDLNLTDLSGTFYISDWKGKEGDYGLTLIILETGDGEIFIDMITWSQEVSRSLFSDAVDWFDDNVVQPVKRTVQRVAEVIVEGVRRTVNWVREQFNRLKGALESKLLELLEDGIDVGDYLNLSLTIIKDGWRFTVTASTPEVQLRFPPFPALSLLISAQGSVYVQKDCNGLTFGGELVLRAHVGLNEDWEVVEIRLTGGVALIINYPDEATVADSHCSSVNAAVAFTLNLEFWASINQPQLDLGASFQKSWELWKDSIPVGPKGYSCDCDRKPRATANPPPDDPFRPPGATTGGENEPEETHEREFGVSVRNRCDHERQLNITTTTAGGSYVYPQSTVADMASGEEITIPTVVVGAPTAGPASRPGIGPGDGEGPGGIGGGGGGKNPPEEKNPKNYNGVTSGKVKKVCEGSATSFDINVTNIGEVLTEYVTVTMTDTSNASYTNSTTFPIRFKESMELLYDAPPGWEVMFYHPGIGYVDDIKGLDENETRQLRAVVKVPEGTIGGTYDVIIRVRLRYHPAVSDELSLRLRVVDELNIIWQDGFESPPGPWTQTGDFQFGFPTIGPGFAVEGANVATTMLGSNYNNNTVSTLRMNDIPLNTEDVEELTLSLWHYVDVAGVYDNCTIWIHTATDTFRLDKFTQDLTVWRREVYDLSNLSAGTISIEFRFETDSFFNEPGWFIDNVSLLSCGKPSDLSIEKVGHLTYNVTNNGNETEMDVQVDLYDYLLPGQIIYSTAFLEDDWSLSGWKGGVYSYRGRRGPFIYRYGDYSGSAVGPQISLERSETPILSFDLYQTYDPEDEVEITIRSPDATKTILLNGSIGAGWNHLEYDLSSFAGEKIWMSINQTYSPSFNGDPVAIFNLVIEEGLAVEDHTDSKLIASIAPDETVTVTFSEYNPDIAGKHLRRTEVLRTCDRDLSDNIHEESYWTISGSGLYQDIPKILSPGDTILVEDRLRWSSSITVILETSQGNLSLGSNDGMDGWAEFTIPSNAPGGSCSVWIDSISPGGTFNKKIGGMMIDGPSPVDLEISVTGGFAGEPINFSFSKGDTEAEVMNVLWDFGEGNLTAEELPFHVFGSTGEFTITLWAHFESLGTSMITKVITLAGNPMDVHFKVLNEDGEPIEGAVVTLGSVEGTTGNSGEASLRIFREGPFDWRVEGPQSYGMACYKAKNGTIQVTDNANKTLVVQLDLTDLPFVLESPSDMKISTREDSIVLNFTGPLFYNYTSVYEPVSLELDGEDWEPVIIINGTIMEIIPNGGQYYGKDLNLTVKGGPSGPLWEDGSIALCRDVTYSFTWDIPDDMVLFGPLEGYEGSSSLSIVDEDKNLDAYGSDFSGTFLIPRNSEGKYALFDSDFFGIALEGIISEEEGKFTLSDTLNASERPKVIEICRNHTSISIEFSHIMRKDTEEFDIDTDGLEGDFAWNGRNLYFNINGGFSDPSKETFTVKVLSTASSMWGLEIKDEASIDVNRSDLVFKNDEGNGGNEEGIDPVVWIALIILAVLFLSMIYLFILRRKNPSNEDDWEE